MLNESLCMSSPGAQGAIQFRRILEDEDREHMLPDGEQQLRSRILVEIGHLSADQFKGRALQFGHD